MAKYGICEALPVAENGDVISTAMPLGRSVRICPDTVTPSTGLDPVSSFLRAHGAWLCPLIERIEDEVRAQGTVVLDALMPIALNC